MRNKTSRKMEDANIINLHGVRQLIEDAKLWRDGIYVFKDAAGRVIAVDIIKGRTALLTFKGGEINEQWYEDGSSSSKKNGYLYTTIAVDRGFGPELIPYGTHTIVALIVYKEEFDILAEQFETPIANHKDNRKWNNCASNLEWVSPEANRIHGKIIGALHKSFMDIYTHIEYNGSGERFVVLDRPLSAYDIREYLVEIRNPHEFGGDIYGRISDRTLANFLVWLGWREDDRELVKKQMLYLGRC